VLAAIRRVAWVVLLVTVVAGRVSAQDAIAVSGVVTTHADGQPIPGAAISVAGADVTATTDAAGRYTLQVPVRPCEAIAFS
jgi:Carboxypeptidase regulatory-like domain